VQSYEVARGSICKNAQFAEPFIHYVGENQLHQIDSGVTRRECRPLHRDSDPIYLRLHRHHHCGWSISRGREPSGPFRTDGPKATEQYVNPFAWSSRIVLVHKGTIVGMEDEGTPVRVQEDDWGDMAGRHDQCSRIP